MSCQRTHETDWAAYAADPQSDEWAEVRAHYPLCRDCSSEVARWAGLRTLLAETEEASAHPSEEELLAHDRFPDRLRLERRAAVAEHVTGCSRCTNELIVLNRLAPAVAPATEPASESAGLLDSLRASLALLFPTPSRAFAAAAVVLALVLALSLARRDEGAPEEQITERPAPQDERGSPDRQTELPEPVLPEVRGEQPLLAHEPTVPDTPVDAPHESPSPVVPEPPVEQLAQEAEPPLPAPDTPEGLPEPERPEPFPLVTGPDMQLAAMLPTASPSYLPGALLSGADLDPTRVDVVIRALGEGAGLRALAPEHLAVSFQRGPRLYFHLAEQSDVEVELLVVDVETDEPVLEWTLAAPVSAGLHALDLAAREIMLEPDTRYRFFVSLVRDPARRDLDVTSGFTLESRPEAAPEAAVQGEQAHALAREGSWLDAFATLSEWIEADPSLELARLHRGALLRQVGLEDVATELEARPQAP